MYLQLSLPIEVNAIEGNENLAIRSFVDIFYLSKIWELEALWTFFIKKKCFASIGLRNFFRVLNVAAHSTSNSCKFGLELFCLFSDWLSR